MKQLSWFGLAWCILLSFAFAADEGGSGLLPMDSVAGPNFADAFAAESARKPVAGEWAEYRVAFPVDPLENSLRTDPAPLPGVEAASSREEDAKAGAGTLAEDTGEHEYEYIQPVFESEVGWRILPVRLIVEGLNDGEWSVVMEYEGGRETIQLPAAEREPEAEFLYDRDGGGMKRLFLRIDGTEYEIDETRRFGSGYGFVRWFSRAAPFGIVRFATEHVDVMLVGRGDDARSAPEFPLRTPDKIEPPLGLLYRHDAK